MSVTGGHAVVGWRCRVCRTRVPITEVRPWRCPRSTSTDRHHVLHVETARTGAEAPSAASMPDHGHPFVVNDQRLAWSASAAALGMTRAARDALVLELDDAIRATGGPGFVVTPFHRSPKLSDELGFAASGGVWVKDETGNVGGSQKARHLFSILLHLRAMELLGHLRDRPRLAIASCGNAALAAATLASAAQWPIDVYVPTWMSDGFGDRLDRLGAAIHRCARRVEDPPGDPAMLRFREAVADGSVPFTVQGPENALCLDGGRTLGWELAAQARIPDGPGQLDAVFVQVGGGAFATSLGAALHDDAPGISLYAVQAEGCAPFDRAARRAAALDDPAGDWASVMTPWNDPESLADGILDDETYDWLGVLDAIDASAGASIVAQETNIVSAHALAKRAGYDVSATGSAGLAGLLEDRSSATPLIAPTAKVAVVMSGVSR